MSLLWPPNADPTRLDDYDSGDERDVGQVTQRVDYVRNSHVQADFLRDSYEDDTVMIGGRIEQDVSELVVGRHQGAPLIHRPGENGGIWSAAEPCVEDMNGIDTCRARMSCNGPRKIFVNEEPGHLPNSPRLLLVDHLCGVR